MKFDFHLIHNIGHMYKAIWQNLPKAKITGEFCMKFFNKLFDSRDCFSCAPSDRVEGKNLNYEFRLWVKKKKGLGHLVW